MQTNSNSLNDFTHWDSQHWWLTLFLMVTLFSMQTTTMIISLQILYTLNIQKIERKHNENKMRKAYGSSVIIKL